MSWFDKISKKIFSSDDQVNIHEVLHRTPGFIDHYKKWMVEEQLTSLKHDVLRSWDPNERDEESPVDMTVFTSDYANGFVIYPIYKDSRIPLAFLMEFIKDQLINISYDIAHADRKMNENQAYVEILEKYYLKPPRSSSMPKDQLYGNVIIELLKHDQEEIRLQFLVNIYSDRLYSRARDFSELLSVIFDI
jgi:hypothetical protein